MTKGSESATSDASESKTVEEKGKRFYFRTKLGMDFNPRTMRLHSQADVDEYLARYGVRLYPIIKVKFCPQDTEFVKSPPNGGVYMHPQIQAPELKLPVTKFVRSVLTYYKIIPSQVSGWPDVQ